VVPAAVVPVAVKVAAAVLVLLHRSAAVDDAGIFYVFAALVASVAASIAAPLASLGAVPAFFDAWFPPGMDVDPGVEFSVALALAIVVSVAVAVESVLAT
jgi:hypothetical protein